MKEFEFRITQTMKGYYEGIITIEAKSKSEAIKQIKEMSPDQLESLCGDWEVGDEMEADGDIEVWNDNGKQIK